MYVYDATNLKSALLGVGGALAFLMTTFPSLFVHNRDTRDANQSGILYWNDF